MSTSLFSAEEQANQIIAPRKLHQIFTLPATENRGKLTVTYSIAGPEIGEDVLTILFCGGFGGSTLVPISQRISTFLETVPALLSHLNITHIHLASHSAGTIYALNLLFYHSNLLSPTNPTVTFFSPWVHQSISSVSFLSLASILPNSLLDHWDNVTMFMIQRASPVFATSSGALSAFTGIFKSKSEEKKKKDEEERKCLESCGVGLKVKKELDRLVFKYAFAENTKGANDEARLCLKSVEGCDWDACENYEVLVGKLKDIWEQRIKEGEKKLRVKIFFGEEDEMIGVKGRKYWEDCWTQERCGEGIEVICKEVEGGDHDSVLDPMKGMVGEMHATVKTESM